MEKTSVEKAKEYLQENSDWFDKSPGGEKLYFESEVIKMMINYSEKIVLEQQQEPIYSEIEVCAIIEKLFDNYASNKTDKAIDDFDKNLRNK